jgi:hypothetical protein
MVETALLSFIKKKGIKLPSRPPNLIPVLRDT